MIKLYIESIGKTLEIENGIYQIIIENPITYRNIVLNVDTEIILSNDNKVFDLNKESIIIKDPLSIDINDSKILKSLYKLLEKTINEKYSNDIYEVEKALFNLAEELIISSNCNLDYESQIDISKVLSSVGIKYKYSNDYFTNLLEYIKISIRLISKNIFIIFGLSNVLCEEEINILNNELVKINSSVIDISFSSVSTKNTSLIVDEDWCIL